MICPVERTFHSFLSPEYNWRLNRGRPLALCLLPRATARVMPTELADRYLIPLLTTVYLCWADVSMFDGFCFRPLRRF